MTFAAFETSPESGLPIELYDFSIGSELFRYTSATMKMDFGGGVVYNPVVLARGTLDVEMDQATGERLEIRMSGDDAFVSRYRTSLPGQAATVTIKRIHRPDVDLETVLLFKGTVRNVSFVREGREAVLQVSSLATARSRTTPRFTYSNLCNHMLYDARCKIDKDSPSFKHTGTVLSVAGNVITVAGAGSFSALADFFESGYAEFQGDFRAITKQASDALTLITPFVSSPLNQSVVVRAGCKLRVTIDCINKFNNLVNFGGFPWVPKKNPFETGLD